MAGRGPKISLALKLVKGFFSPFGIFGHEEGQICTIYLLGDIQSPVSATSAAASMLIYSSLVTEHLRSQASPLVHVRRRSQAHRLSLSSFFPSVGKACDRETKEWRSRPCHIGPHVSHPHWPQ